VQVFSLINTICGSLIPLQFPTHRSRRCCRSVDEFETNWTATAA
jgi:hypothetical protein